MAHRKAASSSGSESEDDAPETFSFNTSKVAAKDAEHALQRYQTAEKQKLKKLNRERDRLRKEQAQAKAAATAGSGKGKGKGASEESDSEDELEGRPKSGLEARMERAMQEAEQESNEDDEAEEAWGGLGSEDASNRTHRAGDRDGTSDDSSDEDSDATGDVHSSNASQSDSSDSEEDPDLEEAPAPRKKAPTTPTYLPDHLFKAAFSTSASSSKRRLDTADEPSESRPRKKQRKRTKRSGKGTDVVVGSRTIRTLAPTSSAVPTPTPRAMMPPPRVNKFLSRSLNLKGKPEPARAKGWERRAANVGVMKRNGPAASFVRNQGYS
ncbi:uncharacterized protein B0H18DRAFT_1013523 [Fomitopsis serialis]|uniref:uncharacterized protein n=1 Tax=Fomitopsis serialis TaxID=139415 RepID=UPI002007F5AB|nr:uncharacterized protein B0H18DRAFT_1013523 [Neoantrodia serialis]KAH9923818.1 hypothetical protein B0H18DRAFT_1013523 [Neoantrodia serialis]